MFSKDKIWSLFFVITAFLLHFSHELNSDEGVILNGAWNLYNHQVLYKDFFEYIAPGFFYFIYFIFLLFSPSYLIAKVISILFLLITTLVFFKINRLVGLSSKISIATSFIWLILTSASYPLINHNTYSTFLVIILTYLALLFIKKANHKLAFSSGILAALIFYFLQTKGLFIILGLFLFFLFLWLRKKILFQHLLFFVGGLIIIFALGYLAWGQVVFTAPFLISSNYLEINDGKYISFISSILLTIFSIWYLKRKDKINLSILFLFVIQLCLFGSILNCPDRAHIALNLFPLIIILALLLKTILAKHQFSNLMFKKIIKILFCVFVFVVYLFISKRFINELSGARQVEAILNDMKEITRDEAIFTHPFMPGLYFELNKPNPYYTNVVETIQGDELFLMKNFEILKEQQPKYILTQYSVVNKFNYQSTIIDEYIFEFYQPIKKYWSIILNERK